MKPFFAALLLCCGPLFMDASHADPGQASALAKLERLPDLRDIAQERSDAREAGYEDLHEGVRTLAKQWRRERKAFKVTEAFRSMERCKSGEHRFARTVIRIELPAEQGGHGQTVEIPGSRVHEVKFHGGAFTGAELAVLASLP